MPAPDGPNKAKLFPEEIKDKHVEVDNPDSFFKQFEGNPWTEIKELFHFNLIFLVIVSIQYTILMKDRHQEQKHKKAQTQQ